MRIGEFLVSLDDIQVAFVLRPSENDLWRLFGDCFIAEDQVASLQMKWENRGKPRENFVIF